VLELRPHLRNCAGCRAALRELRGSSTPLAALFPVGGVALAGGEAGPLAAVSETVARMWHALWGDLSERAASAAWRAQSMAHGLLPGKAVATAASTVALLGGGYAVEEAARPGAPPRAVSHPTTPSGAAEQRMTAARSARPASLVTRAPAARKATARRAKRVRPQRVRRPAVVRAARRAPAARPASVSPPTSTATAPRVAPAAAETRAAVSPAAAAPRPASGGSAGGEFALERP